VNDYVFCALVAGEREARVAYGGDRLLGFMDLHPPNPGHVLLVPQEHASESDT
jgi:diadenosine tetraphosphate (Ap4A) HIT family hydrolase